MVRESDLVLMTRAGPEIGVASTKAFTTQLATLMLLVIAIGRRFHMTEIVEQKITSELFSLPGKIEQVLQLDDEIKALSEQFAEKQHALFLGRGTHYPIAMEGALKLKEISYIHAEAYPAGELKHGPLGINRRRHAGGDRSTEQQPAGKTQIEYAGSQRPRRTIDCFYG